jgi:hypothetical protein
MDRDGEPISGPTTLEDVILAAVSEKIVERLMHRRDRWDETIRQRVEGIRDEEIRERIVPMVEEAISTPVQPTTGFGVPVGEPKDLRAMIVEAAQEWLHKPSDPYDGRRGKSNVRKIIADEVDRAMAAELKEAVGAAKAEVIAAVQAKGAEALAKTITDLAAGR